MKKDIRAADPAGRLAAVIGAIEVRVRYSLPNSGFSLPTDWAERSHADLKSVRCRVSSSEREAGPAAALRYEAGCQHQCQGS
jgi:hypothetical protein